MTNKNRDVIEDISVALFIRSHIVVFAIIAIIIVSIFIWGYYKFAKPVYDEAEELGYGPYETVWIDKETGKQIPKKDLYKYPEIYNVVH